MKMHLYEMFKIDVLGTSQGPHPMDVFLEGFEDVRRMFFQKFKNKQQLIFKYFTQHFWGVGSKTRLPKKLVQS